jgi:hypothetical protein
MVKDCKRRNEEATSNLIKNEAKLAEKYRKINELFEINQSLVTEGYKETALINKLNYQEEEISKIRYVLANHET